jgi:hypothetical protein
MTADEFHALALSFPGVEAGTHYGKRSFLVNRKFLTRLRVEDASAVLMEVGFDEREMLMAAAPETFHITPHYQASPAVLARIATVHPGSLRGLLERRWRKIAPKAAVRAWEAAQGS